MKRPRRWWIVGFVALCCAVAVTAIFRRQPLVYPTPETESAFYRQYSSEEAVKAAASKTENSSMALRDGGTAGAKSTTHDKAAEFHFVIERDRWMALMQSVADDVARQLRTTGAQILDSSGDARQGFHFEYVVGNTLGDATILPLEVPDPGPIRRATPLCPKDVDVLLRVEIHEEWFKIKPGLITARITVQSR